MPTVTEPVAPARVLLHLARISGLNVHAEKVKGVVVVEVGHDEQSAVYAAHTTEGKFLTTVQTKD